MKNNIKHNLLTILSGLGLLFFAIGCERDEDDLVPATFPNNGTVFIDEFSGGLEYAAFGDSKLTAFTVDTEESFESRPGTSSIRFDVPNFGDPEGPFAGGVFRDLGGRDLSGFDALTFYARASQAGTIDLIGFGTDFMGDEFTANTSLNVNTAWTKYIIPIPDPSKLTQEKGLFVLAEGPDENGNGYTLWFDQVKFEKLGTIARPRPKILNGEEVTQTTFIGVTSTITGLTQTHNLPNGGDQTINASPSYFEFSSSDETVATVDDQGIVSVVGIGTAVITATLDGVEASGSLTIESEGQFSSAPIPTRDSSDVISIFSDAYTNVPVDFYNGFFAPFQTTLGGAPPLVINDDNIIKYTLLNFVATEFTNPTVDASQMTHFHVDIQIENPINPGDFVTIQLGDFGPDGTFGGDDDANGSARLENTPPLVSNEWISLDIPLENFTGLTQRANLAQIFFITDGTNPSIPGTITDLLVDNMYFYKEGGGGGEEPIPPTTPAPTPTQAEADVISIYSDAYTDVPNQGFNNFGAAAFEEADISGNNALRYTFIEEDGGNFQVIELGGDNQIDASAAGMTNFRFDLWFPNAVDEGSSFLMKLVDIPEGEASEALINVNSSSNPAIAQGTWLQFDIPFTELESNGLSGSGNIQQVVIDLINSGEVYVDNIYFYKSDGGGGGEDPIPPTTPAPTPTQAEADVISIYSDAYTNVPNQGFNNFGAAAFEEADISGNNALRYTFIEGDGGNFQVIELGGDNQIDASAAGMTNFRFDLWFPNAVDEGSSFLMKLVDIPEGGLSEALINVNSSSNPAIAQGTWLQFDIPFTELESNGLSGSGNIQQVVIDLINSGEVYIDNIYFYNSEGGSGEDITPPVITLNGDAMIDLIIGDMFTDPGATASDNVDGDITSSIVVGGDDVDISTVGTYLITYDVSDAAGNAATQVSRTVVVSRLDGGLITNGDFADGSQSWIIGVDDDAPAPVVTENGNSFYSVNVEVAGNPFDVNLSQKLEIIEGETYTLTFDAWSDRERDILAGIGLSGGDFSSTTETISINTNRQTYSVTVTANGFGATDARVLFDLGAAAGLVNIDNVSLILGAGGGGATNGCDGELVAATSFPVDFEGCETFPSEINFGAGISSGIVANPFKEGINTSDFAFQVIKEAGADFFAGVQNNFAEPFDLNATPTFKMKVYSTKPNVVFRFEVAQDSPDVGNPVPAFRTIENANEWVELSFEFPNAPAPTAYFRLVIKPDNDEVDGPITEDGTYYIDDITLE